MKLIGSHNTMSYLKPKHWWLKPINWLFAQCQTKTIQDQVARCQAFDLRVCRDHSEWYFAHGLVSYKGSTLYSVLNFLENKARQDKTKFYIRLIFEKGNIVDEAFFSEYLCPDLEERFNYLIFYGGYKKKGWVKLYNFHNDIEEHQFVSSVSGKWYETPRMYNNRLKHKLEINLQKGINYFDFI